MEILRLTNITSDYMGYNEQPSCRRFQYLSVHMFNSKARQMVFECHPHRSKYPNQKYVELQTKKGYNKASN